MSYYETEVNVYRGVQDYIYFNDLNNWTVN